MAFSSIPFLIAFIAFLTIYAFLRRCTRIGMMLYVVACSLGFYYLSNGLLMLLLPATALMSWALSGIMSEKHKVWRKLWLTAIVIIDLAPLAYYKYANFCISTFNDILHSNFALLDIALPVGISFFTFQAISHAVDVYRRRFTIDTTLLEYLFYLTFFPIIIAGPITRASTLIPQIRRKQPISQNTLYLGLWLVCLGVIKKCVFADYLAQYNNWVFDDPEAYSGFENLISVFGYSVQIYCDFSGYSDMAIGLAAMMGFKLKDNFRFPYQSLNITEFWRRWHISLSTWFRDYLYIPMGGNRHGKLLTLFNNFFTMIVAGIWHGSTWMFAIWGAIHGAGLVIHKLFKPLLDKVNNNIFVKILCWTITYLFVCVAWVYFRAADIETSNNLWLNIFTNFDIAYLPEFIKARPLWTALLILGLLIQALPEKRYNRLQTRFVKSPWIIKLIFFAIVLQLAIQFHSSEVQPFIYAGF